MDNNQFTEYAEQMVENYIDTMGLDADVVDTIVVKDGTDGDGEQVVMFISEDIIFGVSLVSDAVTLRIYEKSRI